MSCSTRPPVVDERQITSRVGDASSPVLSRDGTAIAFSFVVKGYNNSQIRVDILHCLSECPDVAGEVFQRGLPLTVHMRPAAPLFGTRQP
ncbi:MAG: hypothetical protein ACJ74Z_22575 [Bryobacteraceae bacterium]